MKHLCCKCEVYMEYEKHEVVEEGSVGITFRCPQCSNRVVLLTNPGETMLVHALGVKIGGAALERKPLELTRSTLCKEDGDKVQQPENLRWDKSARKRLERIPEFVRPTAVRAIEQFASERGVTDVTENLIDAYKREKSEHHP